jgi:hypothetical protein
MAGNALPIAHERSEQDNGRYRQDQYLRYDQNLQDDPYVVHDVTLTPARLVLKA